ARSQDLKVLQELRALLRLPCVAALVVRHTKNAPFEELLYREYVVQCHRSNSTSPELREHGMRRGFWSLLPSVTARSARLQPRSSRARRVKDPEPLTNPGGVLQLRGALQNEPAKTLEVSPVGAASSSSSSSSLTS